ncbi:MAG: DUF4421 family protein [Prevotella sp.]|nr:DUF4421 family protein [Prevotella sp.]
MNELKRILGVALLLSLCAAFPCMAEGVGVIPAVTGFIGKVGTFIDSMSVKGLDRRYIDAPKHPWQVILKGNINQSTLSMNSSTSNAEEILPFMYGDLTWEPRIKTNPATYLGVWAGYRGYGIGYSWNVGGDKGRILTFGATGGSYGVNLRIHWFDNDEPQVHMKGSVLTDFDQAGNPVFAPLDYNDVIELGSPIKTRVLFLDGYYLFNKRCSYAAAYDQSVIQKRSAGSLMAGAMYSHSSTEYDENINADLILLMGDIGAIKSDQISAGVGYIYNWVPAKGLLVSAMAIPMLTFYNHHKMWRYDSNLKDLVDQGGWYESFDMPEEDYRIREAEKDHIVSKNSNIKLSYDARLSVTYEWNSRLFINAYGQFNSFGFNLDQISGRLNDWYINASLGVRL